MTRPLPSPVLPTLLLAALVAAGTSPASSQNLDSLVSADLGAVASGAVAGIHHGETGLTGLSAWGYPSLEAGDTLRARAPFPFPALSEFLVAATVRSLAAAGALDTDAPLGRYLPTLPATLGQVTLDQLLRHTSGLDDAPFPEDATLEEAVSNLPAEAAFAPPGVIYSRSRYSHLLAARVLEVVTGLPVTGVIETALFEPLGMSTSTFDREEASRLGLSTGYGATAEAPTDPVPLDPVERVGGLPVLYTSVPDVLQLMAAWMGGSLAAGPDDLPPAPPRPDLEEYVADGLWHGRYLLLDELTRASRTLGHSVVLRAYPETRTVVVAWTNFEGPAGGFGIDRTGVTSVPARVAAVMTERVLGPDVPVTVIEEVPDSSATVGDLDELPLWAWAGTYANGAEILVLRPPETDSLGTELAFFDGTRELPTERTATGTIRAWNPETGQTVVELRALRDEAGRRYAFLGGKAYRRVEEEAAGG